MASKPQPIDALSQAPAFPRGTRVRWLHEFLAWSEARGTPSTWQNFIAWDEQCNSRQALDWCDDDPQRQRALQAYLEQQARLFLLTVGRERVRTHEGVITFAANRVIAGVQKHISTWTAEDRRFLCAQLRAHIIRAGLELRAIGVSAGRFKSVLEKGRQEVESRIRKTK